jgi:hypothetical protein
MCVFPVDACRHATDSDSTKATNIVDISIRADDVTLESTRTLHYSAARTLPSVYCHGILKNPEYIVLHACIDRVLATITYFTVHNC